MKKQTVIVAVILAAIFAGMVGIFFAWKDGKINFGETWDATEETGTDTEETPDTTTDITEEATEAVTTETVISEEELMLRQQETAIDEMMSQMTLQDKICQLFIVRPETLAAGEVTTAGEPTKQALVNYPVGGLIYMGDNIAGYEQVQTMIGNTTQYATEAGTIPLFYSVDEEGGRVARCANAIGTTSYLPMYQYREQGVGVAFDNALHIGRDIHALGFNLDYAPVADTWSNPANTVIGDRAYSTDYTETAELVEGAVRGYHQAGVACSLKHFPGHGDTAEDSHQGLAYSYRSQEELDQNEYLAFQSGIKAEADMVMVGHIVVPELSDRPASISYEVTTGQLRKRLGYAGVIITDGLDMGALQGYGTSPEICVQALEAGADVLLLPSDLAGSVEAVQVAVNDGRLTEARIDESVRRILRVKLQRGIISTTGV